jgi:integrase
LIDATPITKGMVRKGEVVRSRFLTLDEAATVWRAAERLEHPFGPWFKLLMLTGQRRGECAGARWSGFDLENRQAWSLTPEETKAARSHLVPLAPLALEIVKAQPLIAPPVAKDEEPKPAVYVFTTNGRAPVSGYSKAKTALDKEIATAGVTLPEWRIHDLRRTVATHMQATIGIDLAIVGAVLNHAPSSITGKVYAVGDMEFDMRVALTAWARLLTLAVNGGKTWEAAREILTPKTDAQQAGKAEFRRMIQGDEATWASYCEGLTRAAADNVRPLRGAA